MPRAALALALLALATACPRRERPLFPAPDAGRYAAALQRAGYPARVELLPDLRETAGCVPAETRFRLQLGEGLFVNVSRFADASQARACWEDYRDVVSKGGQASWDRLAPLAVLEGRHFFLFPETVVDPALRAQVVEALRSAE
jgi:hypothetical protein